MVGAAAPRGGVPRSVLAAAAARTRPLQPPSIPDQSAAAAAPADRCTAEPGAAGSVSAARIPGTIARPLLCLRHERRLRAGFQFIEEIVERAPLPLRQPAEGP